MLQSSSKEVYCDNSCGCPNWIIFSKVDLIKLFFFSYMCTNSVIDIRRSGESEAHSQAGSDEGSRGGGRGGCKHHSGASGRDIRLNGKEREGVLILLQILWHRTCIYPTIYHNDITCTNHMLCVDYVQTMGVYHPVEIVGNPRISQIFICFKYL